jgi:hypothetical protein
MQIHCFRKRHILVCEKNHSESAKKLSEADIIKMLAAGMLLHINGKFTMGKLKSSLLS